jgi:CubicO group peptidase (beta-lactamase class C family)
VLGELVRRVTGSPIERLLALELLVPLRSGDTYLGLPDAEWPRHVPVRAGGPAGAGVEAPMGALAGRRTFGHNGSGCCIGWADPERGLVVAYLTNRLTTRSADVRHQTNVADALLAACDGTARRAGVSPR